MGFSEENCGMLLQDKQRHLLLIKQQKFWNKEDQAPGSTDTSKHCKKKRQSFESQGNPNPFDLMINYFDKRFKRLEKKLREPFNTKLKIEDTI